MKFKESMQKIFMGSIRLILKLILLKLLLFNVGWMKQSLKIQFECEEVIKGLEAIYRKAFDRLTQSGLSERKVAIVFQDECSRLHFLSPKYPLSLMSPDHRQDRGQ